MNTETSKDKGNKDDTREGTQQQALDQGGHAGMHGHGGQHSGGMGGEHGGDLHDVGSAQSGMTGGAGMGGNDRGAQRADPGSRQSGDRSEEPPTNEVQQSAQREGMGEHRHSARGNEQAIDATTDDDLGSHRPGAARPDS